MKQTIIVGMLALGGLLVAMVPNASAFGCDSNGGVGVTEGNTSVCVTRYTSGTGSCVTQRSLTQYDVEKDNCGIPDAAWWSYPGDSCTGKTVGAEVGNLVCANVVLATGNDCLRVYPSGTDGYAVYVRSAVVSCIP